MRGLEWVFSFVLGLAFFATGLMKVFRYETSRKLLPWVQDVPRVLTQATGVAELLGALGLVLPVITGIYAWLTPVAAVGLALLMLSAAVFHLIRRETTEAGLNGLLLIMLVIIAYVRWPLMP